MTELSAPDRAVTEPAGDVALDPRPAVVGDPRRWQVLAVLCLSLTVITIDTTILNVALPSIERSLDPGPGSLQWIVDAYTVVFAGLLLTAGTLGDRFGRRGALATGLAIFGAASVGAGLADTAGQVIAWRAVTGVGAALIFPATLSILTNVFTDAAERQKAIAVWAGTAGIGIALGPVAGGLLLRHFSWASVFWVNLPVCLFALVAVLARVPSVRPVHRGRLDPAGAGLSIAGLSLLVYAIIEGPTAGWTSATVLGWGALALALLVGFVAVESRHPSPMLDVRLFRDPRFSAASLAMSTLYFALFGTIFLMTQHMQVLLGYDALGAGVRTVPFAVVLVVVANTTPRLVGHVGTGRVIAGGLLLVAVSEVLRIATTPSTGYGLVLASMLVFAVGMGLVIAPATASIMGSVPPERAGVGSAVNDTTRQVGGALGVAVMGSLASSTYRSGLEDRLADVPLPGGALARFGDSVGAAVNGSGSLGEHGATVAQAAREAYVDGLRVASVVAVVLLLVSAAVAARALPSARAARRAPLPLPETGPPETGSPDVAVPVRLPEELAS
jgi:EmrB/QacA subfamily drug resistance transporter